VARVVAAPVAGEDPVLGLEPLAVLAVRERREHGELGEIQLDGQQEIDEALDEVLVVVVEPEEIVPRP